MRAVELKDFGAVENFYLSERPLPEPTIGEARVKLAAAAFNPADYKTRLRFVGGKLPMVLGKDFSGWIDKLGPKAEDLKEGDEVYGYLGGPASNGTYAEYVCAPAEFIARKPKNLNMDQSAAVPLAGLTAYECVVRKAAVKADKAVFIAGGSGGVGSMAIKLARHFGAAPILTLAGSEQSLSYITNQLCLPQEWIISYSGLSIEEIAERVVKANGNSPVAFAFDFVGKDMKHLCSRVLDFDGHMVTIVPEEENFSLNIWQRQISPMYLRSLTMSFEFLGARALYGKQKDWQVYRQELIALKMMIENKQIDAPHVVNIGELSVETVSKAHRMLEQGHVQGKLVMTVA